MVLNRPSWAYRSNTMNRNHKFTKRLKGKLNKLVANNITVTSKEVRSMFALNTEQDIFIFIPTEDVGTILYLDPREEKINRTFFDPDDVHMDQLVLSIVLSVHAGDYIFRKNKDIVDFNKEYSQLERIRSKLITLRDDLITDIMKK